MAALSTDGAGAAHAAATKMIATNDNGCCEICNRRVMLPPGWFCFCLAISSAPVVQLSPSLFRGGRKRRRWVWPHLLDGPRARPEIGRSLTVKNSVVYRFQAVLEVGGD